MLLRSLAIQGSWNYETMVGNGIGFAMEPALRLLPGGVGGEAYRGALARQAQYFNTHPYMASVAIGALARVELDGEAVNRIERFRAALCGPLGASGDRLVWAAWLPFTALLGLLAFGVGAGPGLTLLVFLVSYNVGHLGLRVWGLHTGYARGFQVAAALGTPFIRSGPTWISRAGAAVAGLATPLAVSRGLASTGDSEPLLLGGILMAVGLVGLAVARLQGRYEVWKWCLGALTLLVLLAMVVA